MGAREGGRIRKGPRAGTRIQDAWRAMALYVGTLPTGLSALTMCQILMNISFYSDSDHLNYFSVLHVK